MNLGLLFRVLAPMRNLDRIRQVADGVDEMSREESGYWLGMAMHRKSPSPGAGSVAALVDEHLMAETSYPVIETSTWEVLSVEEMGSKPKFWLMDPDGTKWLFKHRHRPNVGDDWAEMLFSRGATVVPRLARSGGASLGAWKGVYSMKWSQEFPTT